ncbi:MAG: aminotransferase class I/II-fold pyridoxal phosphate-dependent enzyme [Bryobacteraceae bacterium]
MKFSGRLNWDLEANAIADAVAAKRRGGARVLDLTLSNPTLAGIQYPDQAVLRAIAHPNLLRCQPDSAGLLQAREAVARYYGDVPPSSILLTASTSEAYSYVFKLLCDAGDEVLVPRPSYPLTCSPGSTQFEHGNTRLATTADGG